MQINVDVVKTEKVAVQVKPKEILRQLHWEWVCKNSPCNAEYINKDGIWESWVDTGHGSGLTQYYGEATESQKVINEAFKTVLGVLKE
jgi:hypothetical protein